MNRFIFGMLISLLLCFGTALADARSGFEEGLRLYRSNDTDGAIAAWESVVKQGAVSGPLYYNLGNAYYRAKKYGLAILNYERARRLMPRDRDVMSNLDLARLATVDKIEPPVRLMVWNWVDTIRDHFSLRELAAIFYSFGILAAITIIAFLFTPMRMKPALRTVTVLILVCYVLAGGWYGWRSALDSKPWAVIMPDKTDAYSAPDEASKQLFSLHEGTKVQCGENLSGWVSVRLADGRKGWIPVQSVERI